MKIKITKIGGALLAIGACFWSTGIFAQTSTTVTTTRGAFNEYVPGSQTVVVRSDAAPNPIRYSVTKQTTIVDQSGAPVPIDRISPGSQLAIDYSGSGDRMVASRIVVQQPTAVTTHAVNGPAVTEHSETTTTTTRPLTHEEKHAIHEEKEARIKAEKKELHRQKEALEHAEHHIDDDDGD